MSALEQKRRYDAMIDAASTMIERRVAGGHDWSESRSLLGKLCGAHAGDNLAHALFYNGFATKKQAYRYIAGVSC